MNTMPARASLPGSRTSPDGPAGNSVRRRGRVRLVCLLLATLIMVGLRQAPRAASAVPIVGPTGIDVASWQHPSGAGIDFRSVLASGAQFVLIKASQGATYTNPYYAADRSAALAAGMIVGAYDYANPARSPSVEATHFLAVTGGRFATDTLPPVLDLEQTGGHSPAAVSAWALTWLRVVQHATGRVPMVYSNTYFITRQMSADPALAHYRLWYACYTDRMPQTGPGAWLRAGWTFWQYTPRAAIPGVQGSVDGSQFWGTQASLQRFALT